MEGGTATKTVSNPNVVEQLTTLARVTRKLTERRMAGGAIDFEFPGLEVRLDREGRAVGIDEAERTVAHRAIEESMLAANRAVAEKLSEAGAVALHRNHEAPLPTDMIELRELLSSFGLLEGRTGDGPLAPKELADALARVAGRPEDRLVQLAALRSLRQARYGAIGIGHYALAFAHYTHFTSPIRRYADLVVHRALTPLLSRGCRGDGAEQDELDRSEAARIAGRVSWRERQTADVERETLDRKRCALMLDRVGEQLPGSVSSVAEHGVYVRLDVLPVEGLVHRSQLPRAYELDDRRHALRNAKTGERITLGDRLEVEVATVDLSKLRIDFAWVGRLGERE
jgi:ribonuclease R